ncbi:DUF2178 domain-containing protein [Chryseomicrobium sp. FSL W7-1435]|uniref:DUF2178 domain-containing protein n=1 Tax=Chryseomicrobium sp. FSL W7-1435 TaxID=2921704 RepID=UPI00315A51D0
MRIDHVGAFVFSPLMDWAEQSNANFNMVLMASLGLLLLGAALITVYYYRIGKPDERTNQIYLKSTFVLLGAVILGDFILPKEEMWTIFFVLKYGVAFITTGVYLAMQYKREFAG